MKKLLFFFCLLVSSQGLFAYGFSYGVKGGWNYTNIKANNLSTSARQGIHAGLYANLKLPLIAIQPELLYSQKGYNVSGGSQVRMDYLDIPIMVKFSFLPFLSVDAGPQYSILLNTKDLAEGNTLPALPSFSKTQFDGAVGLSAKVWRVGASARYVFGLQELESFNKSKNSMFQLSLQFKL